MGREIFQRKQAIKGGRIVNLSESKMDALPLWMNRAIGLGETHALAKLRPSINY